MVCIATDESFFILKYFQDRVNASFESQEGITEDGIEEAFDVSFFSIIIFSIIKHSIKDDFDCTLLL